MREPLRARAHQVTRTAAPRCIDGQGLLLRRPGPLVRAVSILVNETKSATPCGQSRSLPHLLQRRQRLRQHLPAIDHQRLAGDKGGFVAGEKQRGVGDVLDAP